MFYIYWKRSKYLLLAYDAAGIMLSKPENFNGELIRQAGPLGPLVIESVKKQTFQAVNYMITQFYSNTMLKKTRSELLQAAAMVDKFGEEAAELLEFNVEKFLFKSVSHNGLFGDRVDHDNAVNSINSEIKRLIEIRNKAAAVAVHLEEVTLQVVQVEKEFADVDLNQVGIKEKLKSASETIDKLKSITGHGKRDAGNLGESVDVHVMNIDPSSESGPVSAYTFILPHSVPEVNPEALKNAIEQHKRVGAYLESVNVEQAIKDIQEEVNKPVDIKVDLFTNFPKTEERKVNPAKMPDFSGDEETASE